MMLVSVIIPTFNGKHRLGRCLDAVEAACGKLPPGETEVVVVDDGGTDGTARYVAENHPTARVIRLETNRGFAAAVNAGSRAAGGEWLAVLNDDTAVEAAWISGARLDERPGGVAAVASLIVDFAAGVVQSAGDGYSAAGLAFQRSSGEPVCAAGRRGRVFSACAAAAFYRRSVFLEMGGFDEDFESYYEDVDLGFRLNLMGLRTIYEPESVCRHLGAASHGPASWRRLRNSARNCEIVFFSCMPASLLVRRLPAHAAAVAMQAVLRVFQGGLLPFLAGKAAFAGAIARVLRRRRRIQDKAVSGAAGIFAMVDYNWLTLHAGAVLRRRREPHTCDGCLSGDVPSAKSTPHRYAHPAASGASK